MRGMKITNEYSQVMGREYVRIPKAVFAAVAISFCSAGGDNLKDAPGKFFDEWQLLFENGIVEQKPQRGTL
jgi:hypothetical protein